MTSIGLPSRSAVTSAMASGPKSSSLTRASATAEAVGSLRWWLRSVHTSADMEATSVPLSLSSAWSVNQFRVGVVAQEVVEVVVGGFAVQLSRGGHRW